VVAVPSLLGGLVSTLALAGSAAAHAGPAVSTAQRAASAAPATVRAPAAVPDDKLLGQRIMVGFSGTRAPGWLIGTIRTGHVGAVILFSDNIGTRAQLTALTTSLQRAARQGHNPPVLIATDQEGGEVKRLPNGPPDLSPPQIARTGNTAVAGREGTNTGRYLKTLGINWNLAPVADVPTFGGAFIWQQGRAFSFNAGTVSRFASAFAFGLQDANVAATAKHFPGLGSAPVTTDSELQELHPSARQRALALQPYEAMISRGLDAVLVSLAGFPAYDPSGSPAALSSRIVRGLLRGKLHFGGVAITDGLGAPTGHSSVAAGVLAARAGVDMLLFTDSATGELTALLTALHHGQIRRGDAEAAYGRILALKRKVAGG
jgi:beta-N-acetylhexosaminidase